MSEANGAKRRITMRDVAQQAQVSQSTVSLVLNEVEDQRISEATRQRVWTAARELGYRLGPLGSAPGRKRTPLIAMLVDDLSAVYPLTLLEGVHEGVAAMEHHLAIFATHGVADVERQALHELQGLAPAGVIYATMFTRPVSPPAELRRHRFVLLNCYARTREAPSIVPAEAAGGYAATRHLIERGRRRMAIITGDPWQDAARERLQGYRRALASFGLPIEPHYVRVGRWNFASGFEATLDLMRLAVPPDAIFCQSDSMGRGCLAALQSLGKAVPDEVAIVGYDDRDLAKDLNPPLTTVVLPHTEMGRRAIDFLVGPARTNRIRTHRMKVRCPLVVRSSS